MGQIIQNVYRVAYPASVNFDLLVATIKADSVVGAWSVNENSEGGHNIDVGFLAPPTAQQTAQVDAIIAAHNPAQQSPGQIKKAARDAARASVPALLAIPNLSAQQVETLVRAIAVSLGMDE